MGKITKRKSNGRSPKQTKKNKKMQKHFRTVRKFRTVQNFAQCKKFAWCEISQSVKILHPYAKLFGFLAFSALLSFWFLICNAKFDSNSSCLDDSTNLALIACKNYKISRKMRSVE